jgi:hypothetical protein
LFDPDKNFINYLDNRCNEQAALLVNDELVFEFDRKLTFDEQQQVFLDKMDVDMGSGIRIHGELLVNPDAQQRATFVVMNLVKALQQGNQAVISASCAYLVNRYPELIEVHASDHAGAVKIEMIEK